MQSEVMKMFHDVFHFFCVFVIPFEDQKNDRLKKTGCTTRMSITPVGFLFKVDSDTW